MALVMLGSTNQTSFIETSSGITFAKMVMAAIFTRDFVPLTAFKDPILRRESDSRQGFLLLPPHRAADDIVEVHSQHRTFKMILCSDYKRAYGQKALRRIIFRTI